MSLGGYGQGGVSRAGQSPMYRSLPWAGYQEQSTWLEEWIDAIGNNWLELYAAFVDPTARAALLDPTTADATPGKYLATATQPPTLAPSSSTMLDLLVYLMGIPTPLDANVTVAQKQALAQIGQDLLKRKGTRRQFLRVGGALADNVVIGYTGAEYNFSLIYGDQWPANGFGQWAPKQVAQGGTVATTSGSTTLTGTSTAFDATMVGSRIVIGANQVNYIASVASATSATLQSNATATISGAAWSIVQYAAQRPWLFAQTRNALANVNPSVGAFGVGYSQFRAGISAAGEPTLPSGATLGLFVSPSFDSWTGSAPNSWTVVNGGVISRVCNDASINQEFTGSALKMDITAVGAGATTSITQSTATAGSVNHEVVVDYAYSNPQSLSALRLTITESPSGLSWNGSGWAAGAFLALPPSSSRTQFKTSIVPRTQSSTTTTRGTRMIDVTVSVVSDGTATTQQVYTLYSCNVYPQTSDAIEAAAQGERTAWYELHDCVSLLNSTGTSGTIVLPYNAQRSTYDVRSSVSASRSFPYHGAVTGFGFRSSATWTNLLKGSNDFGADWALSNASSAAATVISPQVGETVASAPTLTASATGAYIEQGALGTPTSLPYVCGVWAKKLSGDGAFTDVTLSLISTSTKSQTFTVTQAQGWVLLPFATTFGVGDVAALKFRVSWGAASASGQIAVASAYCYQAGGCLYPPVTQTAVGLTGTVPQYALKGFTDGTNVLDPLLQRPLASVKRGLLSLTIVPVYDGTTQPNAVIFDLGQGAAQNRLRLSVQSGALEVRRWDGSGTQTSASLTLVTNAAPTSSQMTWQRDTAIAIRVRWNTDGTLSLSAGNGNASGAGASVTYSDTGVSYLRMGCDLAGANFFDGMIRDLEVIQVGGPTS